MPYAKRLGIAVVMLLLFGSPRAIALAPQGLQERRCSPSLLSGETQVSGAWQKYSYRQRDGIIGAKNCTVRTKGCSYDHRRFAVLLRIP